MQILDVLPTALVCIVEAMVVFGIDLGGDALKSMLGVADEGASLMAFLALKLMLQFVLGLGAFFALAYAFRLKPMEDYAKIVVGVVKGRFPTIAVVMNRRLSV